MSNYIPNLKETIDRKLMKFCMHNNLEFEEVFNNYNARIRNLRAITPQWTRYQHTIYGKAYQGTMALYNYILTDKTRDRRK